MSRCLTVAEFVAYILGDHSRRRHLQKCARCSTLLRTFANSPFDLETGHVPEASELREIVDAISRRREQAASAVDALERSLPHRWQAVAESDTRLHSPEGVRELLARATKVYPATPRRSLALAQLALSCCSRSQAHADVRFDTLKELAKYQLLVGDDIDASLAALDDAEATLADTSDPTYLRSILAFARASVFGHSTCARWTTALTLLDEAQPTLRSTDPGRWRMAQHLRASVLLRASRTEEACTIYRELLSEETGETARAALSKDLGWCYVRLFTPRAALPLFDAAIVTYSRVGANLDLANTRWGQAEALSALGVHGDAIQTLDWVSRTFAAAGLYDDELGAELSAVRAIRAARGHEADVEGRLVAAYQLACALDARQPLRSGTRRADLWAQLKAYAERGGLTFDRLDHAAEYLRTIGRGDERPFTPLQ